MTHVLNMLFSYKTELKNTNKLTHSHTHTHTYTYTYTNTNTRECVS